MDKDPSTKQNPAENEATVQPEIISFKGGEEALLYKGPEGAELDWQQHKWVDNPARRTANTLIVATASGNQYIIGRGFVIDGRTGVTHLMPQGSDDIIPNITFGQPWEMPGEFKTTKVTAVLAKYKTRFDATQEQGPESPFIVADRVLEDKVMEAQEQYGNAY